jgi:hypothetical protein
VEQGIATGENNAVKLEKQQFYLWIAIPYPYSAYIYFAVQVLFKDGAFQWKRLENLIVLAKENVTKMSSNPALKKNSS